MLFQPPLPAVDTSSPVVIIVAIVAGLIAFVVLRTVFRVLNTLLGLGCLVIVAVAVYLILRTVIK